MISGELFRHGRSRFVADDERRTELGDGFNMLDFDQLKSAQCRYVNLGFARSFFALCRNVEAGSVFWG